jgi:hypothetical protein
MSDPNEPRYSLKVSEESPTPDYMDGFADGYSRAWIECWEHMRQIAQDETEKQLEPKEPVKNE